MHGDGLLWYCRLLHTSITVCGGLKWSIYSKLFEYKYCGTNVTLTPPCTPYWTTLLHPTRFCKYRKGTKNRHHLSMKQKEPREPSQLGACCAILPTTPAMQRLKQQKSLMHMIENVVIWSTVVVWLSRI